MTNTPIPVQLLTPGAQPPHYANPGDAGADLRSRVEAVIRPGQRKLIPTGVAIGLPGGLVGLVHPRSGLAHKHGVTVLNTPGTIDSGYRGEIMVNLINLGDEPFHVTPGLRIAQLVVQRFEHASFHLADELGETVRGTGGHGSTGTQ